MRQIRRKRKLSSEINVVPYIDIMLVLLVVFMVTAPLFSQGYQVNLPEASPQPVSFNSPDQIVISVSSTGEYYYSNDGNNDLLSVEQIQARISELNPEDIQVFIQGDADVNYGSVISLMSALQDSGISDIGLVTQPSRQRG